MIHNHPICSLHSWITALQIRFVFFLEEVLTEPVDSIEGPTGAAPTPSPIAPSRKGWYVTECLYYTSY